MEETYLNSNHAKKIVVSVFIFSLIYVVVRYHVYGGVPWKDFPFFIMNKVISLSALLLMSINIIINPLKKIGIKISDKLSDSKVYLGYVSFSLILLHAFLSLLIFNSHYYSKFFESDGTLTLLAGMSMLSGVLALVILRQYNNSSKTRINEKSDFLKFIKSKQMLNISFVLTGTHLFFMGYKGWLTPHNWNGGIPPVSLIAFMAFALSYSVKLITSARR